MARPLGWYSALSNASGPVSRWTLLDAINGDKRGDDGNLRRHIHNIRKRLGPSAIRNDRGFGYELTDEARRTLSNPTGQLGFMGGESR